MAISDISRTVTMSDSACSGSTLYLIEERLKYDLLCKSKSDFSSIEVSNLYYRPTLIITTSCMILSKYFLVFIVMSACALGWNYRLRHISVLCAILFKTKVQLHLNECQGHDRRELSSCMSCHDGFQLELV